MEAFILFILINLLYLSKQVHELRQFESSSLTSGFDYYLNTSIFKKNDYITFNIKFTTYNSESFKYTLASRFDNILNFSKLSQTSFGSCEHSSDPEFYPREDHKCNYYLKMNNNYKYLLLRYINVYVPSVKFTHTNPPPCSAIYIEYPYLPNVVKGNNYIAIYNNNKNEKYLYFSFSFEKDNKIEINEYNIYYTIENSYDDRSFQKSLNYYSSINPRLKNNRYTFYYKLPLLNNKNYICLKPGKETSGNDSITLTQLLRLPYELNKSKNISNSNNDYIYTNISNISIGDEVYYKIVIYSGNLIFSHKFNDENFYEDYKNMIQISPKNKDFKNGYQTEYYNFKKEKNSSFLLLEVMDAVKGGHYNVHIYQKEKDEYQPPKTEITPNKKTIMILLICFGTVLLIIIIIFIILYRRKKLARKNYVIEKFIDNDVLMSPYPSSYDDQMEKSINE